VIFKQPMWLLVSQYEGKGGFVCFSDGVGEYHPEADRATYSGGGILVDVPGKGQILEDFNTWQQKNEDAFNADNLAVITENHRLLQEGAYNNPPEPVKMVSTYDPVTGARGEQPENKNEEDARMVREAGDAAIRQGHITHDELTPDEVDKLSPSEYQAWRKSHPDR